MKKKKNILDDDEMLDYLKFSHLQPIKENNVLKIDKETQIPDIRNKIIQTEQIHMNHKETDTYDDLNKMDENEKYTLKGNNKNFGIDEQTQVNSHIVRKYEPETPPSEDDDEGFLERNLNRGFRLAEFALNTAIVGADITMALSDAFSNMTLSHHQSSSEEEQPQPQDVELASSSHELRDQQPQEEATGSVDIPRHLMRERSRSRDSSRGSDERRDTDLELGDRLLRRGASRSRSNSLSSGMASSAKTTPRKKNKLTV